MSAAALLTLVAATDHASAAPIGSFDPIGTVPTKPVIVTCAAPTLAQCQDTAYLATYCGGQTKAACGDLVRPLYEAEVRALPSTTRILKTGAAGYDTLQTAKQLAPVAMPERKLSFGTLSFSTAVQLGRVKPPYADTANVDPQHPDYEANGNAIASCQEYAYESLYDHERFAEAADTCGSNAECVYQLSLRASTPTLKPVMLKKNGQPMSFQVVRSGAYSAYKSAFFVRATELRNHPDYATNAAFRTKIEQIIAHVNGTPKVSATSELAWHRQMHDIFAANPVPPAELASIRSRVSEYSAAEGDVGAANFAIALLEAVLPGQAPADQVNTQNLLNQYRAQKARGVATMARLAIAEWDHLDPATGVADRGCLSRTSVKCDWSPRRFVERYAYHPRTETEKLFNACITATAGNFSKVPAAYRTDTNALATWIESQSLPKLGTEIVGERMSDGDEWGDRDWFAAGYSYDAGWQLAAERQASSQRICKLKGNAYATANANAWALGTQIPVFDTRHKLSVRETGDAIIFHSHLRVVGEDLYTPIDFNQTLPSATPVDKQYEKTLAQRTYTKWLTIAGVGVKLQAKAELKAGADIKARATAASGCNPDNLAYDASISVRPWINVHVVPEVSVGVGIIQGGVRGDVDLIQASAPASGSVKLVGGINDITLQLRASTVMNIDALDGNISVFLESCIPYVGCADLASKQIYSWDGYSWQIPIFNYSKDVKINVFDAATKPSTTFPGTVLTGNFTTATLTAAP
ncbi:MAG: hypothetical protein JST00_18240 [Deltaproteobacteria bacterium]|nr:hypothetical protein [Deltaproteobacteria bacterium]